jgi:hypothetical protein
MYITYSASMVGAHLCVRILKIEKIQRSYYWEEEKKEDVSMFSLADQLSYRGKVLKNRKIEPHTILPIGYVKKEHGLIFLLHVHSTGTAAPLLCSRYLLLVWSVLLSSPPCSSSSLSLGGPSLAWPRGGSGAGASGWRARKSWSVARVQWPVSAEAAAQTDLAGGAEAAVWRPDGLETWPHPLDTLGSFSRAPTIVKHSFSCGFMNGVDSMWELKRFFKPFAKTASLRR